ncbi:bile acid:sodium symporter family protein [Shimia sp.]|uniref:bile acid:sodium symporter family protein n=1 Tax=Shimia sp. TaxID=1954381 RepID=UPI003B8D0318
MTPTGLDAVALNFSASSLTALNAVLAVVMFSIAIDLKPADFRQILHTPRALVTGLASQFILLPMLTFVLVVVADPQPSIALGLILVAACPGGNISNYISHRAGGNTALSVSLTACATVGAILLTPLNVAVWGGLYQPTRDILQATEIDPLSVAITVGLMLVLPLCLGITLNTTRPEISARIRRPLQGLAMVIFIAFIALALAANWTYFLQFAGTVALLVLVHNALALAGGFGLATFAGVSAFDRRAITIETGIQNSGLGLVLIFAFFDGLGGMAVVAAFWGIWHAITGLGLAALMNRTKAKR